MFMIKIILFESVSVLLCIFHISFRARSYGKIVRLFNLPTGKKQLCSKSFLLPDIELSSSLCLARYDNILIGKPVNVTIWQREGLQTCRSEYTNSCNVHQVSVPGYYSLYYYYYYYYYYY